VARAQPNKPPKVPKIADERNLKKIYTNKCTNRHRASGSQAGRVTALHPSAVSALFYAPCYFFSAHKSPLEDDFPEEAQFSTQWLVQISGTSSLPPAEKQARPISGFAKHRSYHIRCAALPQTLQIRNGLAISASEFPPYNFYGNF
jgi:hypothetical protein